MRFAFVLFIALAAVAMSESLRPVPKVLKSPEYKFDRRWLGSEVMHSVRYLENQVRSVESYGLLCGIHCLGQDVILKVIGNYGLMGKQFEITYNHYSGTYCNDELFSYAEKYVLDYVSETEEDGAIEITTKTTGGYVRLSSSRFSGNIVTCDSNDFQDDVFYDVT